MIIHFSFTFIYWVNIIILISDYDVVEQSVNLDNFYHLGRNNTRKDNIFGIDNKSEQWNSARWSWGDQLSGRWQLVTTGHRSSD